MAAKPVKSKKGGKLQLAVVFSIVVLTGVSWIVTGGWFWRKPVKVESTQILMNTSVNVQVFVKDKKTGERLIREAFREAGRIEHIMEPLKGDGELKKLNERTRDGWWVVSSDLKTVLEETFSVYERTGGAFDPTIAPVKWLWDFETGGRLPGEQELREKLGYIGLSQVTLRGDSLMFQNPEIRLDLGGVAKGYAVDKMLELLRAGGASAVLVNAGGDISMFGKKPGGKDWIIGLRHPRLNHTLVLDTMPYSAVATSGDYERYFMADGVRYHHILNPDTGYPARECISVTTWTTSAMTADILSTAIFVLGPGKGLAFAESLDDVETLIFFEKNGKVEAVMSSGIKGKVRM